MIGHQRPATGGGYPAAPATTALASGTSNYLMQNYGRHVHKVEHAPKFRAADNNLAQPHAGMNAGSVHRSPQALHRKPVGGVESGPAVTHVQPTYKAPSVTTGSRLQSYHSNVERQASLQTSASTLWGRAGMKVQAANRISRAVSQPV